MRERERESGSARVYREVEMSGGEKGRECLWRQRRKVKTTVEGKRGIGNDREQSYWGGGW